VACRGGKGRKKNKEEKKMKECAIIGCKKNTTENTNTTKDCMSSARKFQGAETDQQIGFGGGRIPTASIHSGRVGISERRRERKTKYHKHINIKTKSLQTTRQIKKNLYEQ
jgi:hypothetical protein